MKYLFIITLLISSPTWAWDNPSQQAADEANRFMEQQRIEEQIREQQHQLDEARTQLERQQQEQQNRQDELEQRRNWKF